LYSEHKANMNLSPTEILNERKIFLIGSTGFLGKVTLSMLLHRFPNIGRVYVTVRARSQEESEARFWNSVITAPPFDPLRERYGSALDGFIRDKVVVLGGDIAEPNLGYSEEEAQAQLETAINWGRYAELFSFNENRGMFRLEEPEPVEAK